MSKPREFWLVYYAHAKNAYEVYSGKYEAEKRYGACGEYFPAKLFHVKEVDAEYDKAVEELAKLALYLTEQLNLAEETQHRLRESKLGWVNTNIENCYFKAIQALRRFNKCRESQ